MARGIIFELIFDPTTAALLGIDNPMPTPSGSPRTRVKTVSLFPAGVSSEGDPAARQRARSEALTISAGGRKICRLRALTDRRGEGSPIEDSRVHDEEQVVRSARPYGAHILRGRERDGDGVGVGLARDRGRAGERSPLELRCDDRQRAAERILGTVDGDAAASDAAGPTAPRIGSCTVCPSRRPARPARL